jgi:hypothetical protein
LQDKRADGLHLQAYGDEAGPKYKAMIKAPDVLI